MKAECLLKISGDCLGKIQLHNPNDIAITGWLFYRGKPSFCPECRHYLSTVRCVDTLSQDGLEVACNIIGRQHWEIEEAKTLIQRYERNSEKLHKRIEEAADAPHNLLEAYGEIAELKKEVEVQKVRNDKYLDALQVIEFKTIHIDKLGAAIRVLKNQIEELKKKPAEKIYMAWNWQLDCTPPSPTGYIKVGAPGSAREKIIAVTPNPKQRTCKKCGEAQVTVFFQAATSHDEHLGGIEDTEHLDISCGKCGYFTRENCADLAEAPIYGVDWEKVRKLWPEMFIPPKPVEEEIELNVEKDELHTGESHAERNP